MFIYQLLNIYKDFMVKFLDIFYVFSICCFVCFVFLLFMLRMNDAINIQGHKFGIRSIFRIDD